MGNHEVNLPADVVDLVPEESPFHRRIQEVRPHFPDGVVQLRGVRIQIVGDDLPGVVLPQQGGAVDVQPPGVVRVRRPAGEVFHCQGQGVPIEIVGVGLAAQRVGNRLRVGVPLQGQGKDAGCNDFHHTEQQGKAGGGADDAGKNPIGYGRNAPALHEVLAAPDGSQQHGGIGEAEENAPEIAPGKSQQPKGIHQQQGNPEKAECQQGGLPPAAAFGREERTLFPGGCPGFPEPAEVGEQLRCAVKPQHGIYHQIQEVKRGNQQAFQVIGIAPDGKEQLRQYAEQQHRKGKIMGLFHAGADVLHLHHRVCLDGNGMRVGVAENLHDAPAGGQFPPGGAAHLPEILLFLQGGGIQIRGLLKIHHRVPHFRGGTAAVAPEPPADVLQLPAPAGHLLQMAGHAAEIVIGKQGDFPLYRSVEQAHDSISPFRPM